MLTSVSFIVWYWHWKIFYESSVSLFSVSAMCKCPWILSMAIIHLRTMKWSQRMSHTWWWGKPKPNSVKGLSKGGSNAIAIVVVILAVVLVVCCSLLVQRKNGGSGPRKTQTREKKSWSILFSKMNILRFKNHYLFIVEVNQEMMTETAGENWKIYLVDSDRTTITYILTEHNLRLLRQLFKDTYKN